MVISILHRLKELMFTYDIACQWIIHFFERMESLPEHLQIPEALKLLTGIPKAHCPGHLWDCQCQYSMGIQPGAGRTDGEAIERLWAFIRMCAASIKEMGPGSRSDTLNDQFGYTNWCKLVTLGMACLILCPYTDFSRFNFSITPEESA